MKFLEKAESKLARQPELIARRSALGRIGRLGLGLVAFVAGSGVPRPAGAQQLGCCFLLFDRCATDKCPDRTCTRYRWMCQERPDCTRVCGECYSPCSCSFTYRFGEGCHRLP
jgi:hypothetical protein